MISALESIYIIDGVQQELTPARILGDASADVVSTESAEYDPVVDESPEPGLDAIRFETFDPDVYLGKIMGTRREVPLAFAGNFTRARIAGALIDAIWRKGHFKLGDLALKASWRLNPSVVGNMAAFYRSVEAAGDYVNGLGLGFSGYDFCEAEVCSVDVRACLADVDAPEDLFVDQPYRTDNPELLPETISSAFDDDPQSWIVYVPFETADYRLGGSMLAQVTEQSGGVDPQIQDADYFIDCYEVVRELVEDGVAVAGTTVLDGGLLPAVKRMTGEDTGAVIDISDMVKAFQENNIIRLLFAEVPGVVIQVRDIDFDYIDAELLLQDVAFFPLGHPVRNGGKVFVKSSAKTGIQNILDSLIRNQCGEGED